MATMASTPITIPEIAPPLNDAERKKEKVRVRREEGWVGKGKVKLGRREIRYGSAATMV